MFKLLTNNIEKNLYTKEKVYCTDSIYNGKEYLFVKLILPDVEDFKNRSILYLINKMSYQIEEYATYCTYFDQFQYTRFVFNNTEFNTIDISTIQNKLSSYYDGSFTYENLKTKSKESLELGSIIKHFKGKSFINDSTIIFPKKGKIYVIDFWYTSCLPCIQAIPTINKLYDKYKHNENIVFLGVNSLISDVEDKSKIEKFIKRTPIDYPIILANANDIKDLLIHQYPTFYIIDREGKLVFKQIGYNPNQDFLTLVDDILKNLN